LKFLQLTQKEKVHDLLRTVLILKFPKLSVQQIEEMFLLSDLKLTTVYLEAREEEAKTLLEKQLTKRFGKLSDLHTNQISELEITQLEELAEALLDFENISDLDRWLANLA
jgi:predicted transposase YdaD